MLRSSFLGFQRLYPHPWSKTQLLSFPNPKISKFTRFSDHLKFVEHKHGRKLNLNMKLWQKLSKPRRNYGTTQVIKDSHQQGHHLAIENVFNAPHKHQLKSTQNNWAGGAPWGSLACAANTLQPAPAVGSGASKQQPWGFPSSTTKKSVLLSRQKLQTRKEIWHATETG